MTTKITVNGVTYDSIEAMPPEARRLYEQAMAKLPELADRDRDGIPDVVQSQSLFVRPGVTVRKKIVVNGTTYDSEAAMPPDVRQLYQQAMRTMSAGKPTMKTNEIKMSFQVSGPGFRRMFGAPLSSQPQDPAAGPVPGAQPTGGTPMPRPIDPASAGGGLRTALILGICAAGGLILWFLTRAH